MSARRHYSYCASLDPAPAECDCSYDEDHRPTIMVLRNELAQVKAERDRFSVTLLVYDRGLEEAESALTAARERIARLEGALCRMCVAADFMPDDVAELLHASTPKEPT